MDEKTFNELNRGDIVRSRSSGESFVVDGDYDVYYIAVCSRHLSNPDEWDLVQRAQYIQVGLKVESASASPPKSKFMEDWESIDMRKHPRSNMPGFVVWIENLVTLIDKHKADKNE